MPWWSKEEEEKDASKGPTSAPTDRPSRRSTPERPGPPPEPPARQSGPRWRASESKDANSAVALDDQPSIWRNDEGETDDQEIRVGEAGESGWRATEMDPKPIDVTSPPHAPLAWREEEGLPKADAPPSNGRVHRPRQAPVVRWTRTKKFVRILSVWMLLLMALALVADIAYVGFSLRTTLENARTSLADAREAFEQGDLDSARAELTEALSDARAADSLTDHPGFIVTSRLPDGRALKGLTDAARYSAIAGLVGVDAAAKLGVENGNFASDLYENGAVRFDALEAARPDLEELERLLDKANGSLAATPEPVIDQVADAVAAAQEEISSATTSAHKVTTLFRSLPSLLGHDGTKRYLLAFQATGEARATGGLFGYFGVLKAEDGRLSLVKTAPLAEIGSHVPKVEAPKWFEDAYGPQGALDATHQVNVSPNFPVVSEVFLRMYEEATGDALDGVVAMDPEALSSLMEATGPVSVPGFDTEVTSENVEDLLLRDSYVEFDTPEAQNAYLSGLIEAFWSKVKEGDFDSATLGTKVAESVGSQHFKVFSRNGDDQAAMEAVDSDGDYEVADGAVQMVFNNNYSANKVDYYLKRNIDTHVVLSGTGEADVNTTIEMTNEAPDGPASLLLGPAPTHPDDEPGMNRMIINVLLPEDADTEGWTSEGGTREASEYSDEGHPVAWESLGIPAGETTKVGIRYRTTGLSDITEGGGEFNLTLFPQATVNPDRFTFSLEAPYGFLVRESGSDDIGSSTYSTSGTLTEPTAISLQLIPR